MFADGELQHAPRIFIPALGKFLSIPIDPADLRKLITAVPSAKSSKGKRKSSGKGRRKEAKETIATRVLVSKTSKFWQLGPSQFVISNTQYLAGTIGESLRLRKLILSPRTEAEENNADAPISAIESTM